MIQLRLAVFALAAAACGSSGGARGKDAAAPPGEPAATAPTAASAAPAAPAAPAGSELRAVPLAAATWYEGAPETTKREPPTRVAACSQLGVFEEGWEDACKPGLIDGGTAKNVPAPWSSADVVRLNAGGEQESTACALIIGVGGAAYVAPTWLEFCDDDDKALASAKWSTADVVPGGAPELVLELTRDEQEILDNERTPSGSFTYRAWCGLGASGKPSCTPPVELEKAAALRPVFP